MTLKQIFETKLHIKFHQQEEDGRIDSALFEKAIIQEIEKLSAIHNFRYSIPAKRHWYDIKIVKGNEIFYINIKVTQGNNADNISSKLGFLYAVTGCDIDNHKSLSKWAPFNDFLVENVDYSCNADYYFLVYYKETEKILFTSLKQIETLIPNGNNLPFQTVWNKAVVPTNRSNEEQTIYLIRVFQQSFLKKVSGLENILRWREPSA